MLVCVSGSKTSSEMAEHMSDSSIDEARDYDGVTPRREYQPLFSASQETERLL